MNAHRLIAYARAVAVAACLVQGSVALGQGPVLSGAGAVNRSMGGASTAAPLDAIGALYWNPAGIGGLDSSRLELGLELLYPQSAVWSSIPRGAVAPGLPAGSLYDKTRDEAGIFPLPTGGFVLKQPDSRWTLGFGLFPAAGFGVNYPGNPGNPILSPPPPDGLGLGPIYSNYQVLQIAPTVAYQMTDRLYVGFSPIVDLARLSLTPGVIVTPNDANGDGFPRTPSATSTRFTWGAGFMAGVYYRATEVWSLGASFKSPQWFEPFRFRVSDEVGRSRTAKFNVDAPLIVSLGTAYTGIERLTLAADVRYFNFNDTAGFRHVGYDPAGTSTGLGWRDVFSLALGSQYQVSEKMSVRLGYTYNTNPIPSDTVTFNVFSPLTYQHQVATGASYLLTPNCIVSAAYYHVFYRTVTGPYLIPSGPIPGASVSTGAGADSLLMTIGVKF